MMRMGGSRYPQSPKQGHRPERSVRGLKGPPGEPCSRGRAQWLEQRIVPDHQSLDDEP